MSLLEGRGVTKRFGGLNAVEDLDFALETGEIVGLIGPNGAGKTTLVNVITGLLPIDAGSVELKGRSLDRLRAHERNRLGIARTFQIVRPFRGLTVVDNVLAGALFGRAGVGRDRARPIERAEAVLEMVGLSAKARLVAEHLTVADKKRVELARALSTR
jgi:branched-chain amino acid transport system ATP-binding protein